MVRCANVAARHAGTNNLQNFTFQHAYEGTASDQQMLDLRQQLRLQQKLSPQQIQYIKLLQLPTLALEQRIQTELESNPTLEEGTYAEDDMGSADPEDEAAPEQDDDFDWEELLAGGDDLYGYKAQVDQGSQDEERREIPLAARPGIVEHLRDQRGFLDLDPLETLIADQIIGSIDEDGYLRRTAESIVDDISFNHGELLSEEDVERVLAGVQRLDPVGIAARDLRECLLVQLEVMPEDTPGRSVAIGILKKAFRAFTMKHFAEIKKKLAVDDKTLKRGYDLIMRLNPKPGEGSFTAQQNYITPDFVVRYHDDDFIIQASRRNTPELRVSAPYRKMLQTLSDGKKGSRVDEETRKFLKTKIESARWFIDSIHQRRRTMLRVMEAIVHIQEKFFRQGEGHLRPMILKDVAEIINMDISTVSRVVNGKYVQSDFGVYELKYFFSEGLSTSDGESVSNKEVKAIIGGIVGEEDKAKPLSDQKIARLLEDRGFRIARRTVTKYREQLQIPVARLRKEIVLK